MNSAITEAAAKSLTNFLIMIDLGLVGYTQPIIKGYSLDQKK